jgi:Domain of unknown function (DUF5615)
MIRFAADENFNNDILRAAWRMEPTLDSVRVQDSEASGFDDPNVLIWLSKENRILFTHDVNTMPDFASQHLAAGHSLPGIFLVNLSAAIGNVARDILLVSACSEPEEWIGQIRYLPLK